MIVCFCATPKMLLHVLEDLHSRLFGPECYVMSHIANPEDNSTWHPVTLIPVEWCCKWDTFLNLEEHSSVTELFCSSILFWLIIFEACQCLENKVQMSLAWDQLYLPALAHIFVVANTKVVFLTSLWHFIAYQLQGEYLQGCFVCAWKMEGAQLCAGMLHQGAMFCQVPASPSVGSKHREPNSSFQCPAEEFSSQPLSTATACWFCCFTFFRSASGWPPTCLTSPTGAQRARPGGPVTFTLSGSNCSPASGQGRNFCQLNLFICLNYFNSWSSWCCSLFGKKKSVEKYMEKLFDMWGNIKVSITKEIKN